MTRYLMPLAVLGACCLCSEAQLPPGVKSMPAPAIPVNPDPRGGPAPHHPPLPRVQPPSRATPAPPPGGGPGAIPPLPKGSVPPLPQPDASGAVYLAKLRMAVRVNTGGVVEVVSVARNPLYVLVARDSGLSTEVFVPGDTIYGFGGRAVAGVEDLHELSQAAGWHYVEGICNGTNVGKSYIGRVHVD